ncbi:MAG: hypothetical protein M3N52_11775 [Actinomycetota bacterium]|nr:hypothetical protein [Actinomycetota bacterium]
MKINPRVHYARVAREACRDVAEEIVREIRAHRDPWLTGELLNGYRVKLDGDGALIINEATRPGRGGVVHYWKYVEFGTLRQGPDRPDKRPHVRPAIERVRARRT